MTFPKRGRKAPQTFSGMGRFGKPPRIKVYNFGKAAAFDERLVINGIVSGQQSRRKLEAIDQQSTDIIGRIIDRAHDFIASLLAKPLCRGVEKRRRHCAVINAFEKAEATGVRLVKRIVVRIIARHDSPDDFSIAPSQEKRGVAVLEKWMFFSIKEFFSLEQ